MEFGVAAGGGFRGVGGEHDRRAAGRLLAEEFQDRLPVRGVEFARDLDGEDDVYWEFGLRPVGRGSCPGICPGRFPYLTGQSGYNKRLRAAVPLLQRAIRAVAADAPSKTSPPASPHASWP